MGFPFFIACVLLLTVVSTSASNNCSSVDCYCTDIGDGTWAADCSKRNLNSMPIFQMNVSKIDLSHNNLEEVGITPPLPLLLKELNIYKNNLTSISATVFQNLTYMEDLNLAENNLWWDDSPKLSFINNLSNLRSLNILSNTYSKSNVSYPFQSFKNLEKLESLKIDGLLQGDFKQREWNLTSLTRLSVSGKIGKCYFEKLEEGFFGGLPNLKYLVVTGCPIRTIDRGVFSSLHWLHTLDLSNNEFMTFAVLENVSYDLQFTNVQNLHAKKIHCRFGLGTYLSVKQIFHFQNTSIKHLDLSSNRMEMMDTDVPKYFPPNMTFLNISDNHLTWGMYMLTYQFLTHLKVADFSKQNSDKSENLPWWICENSIDCTYINDRNLDIQSGLWSDISTPFPSQSVLGSSNRNITFNVPPSLEKLFFHDTNFIFTIRKIHLRNNHCKEYHLQNSIFNSLTGPMYGMEYAEYLDFSGNLMHNISQFFFETFPNITYLDLSKNILGSCIHENVGFDHFQALKKLKEIKLSYNEIASLPSNFLASAWSLQRIDLSHNLITNFTITLNDSTPLKYLDLAANRLHILSRETMQHLQSIHERNNLNVSLLGNLFDCTCEALNFLQWIKDSKIHFIKKYQYKCKTSHSRVRNFNELDNILKDLKQECRSNIPRTIGITVFVVAILTVGIVGTLFKFRWTVRYFYYLTKWKIQDIVNPTNQYKRDYKYSAFVAYTEKDSFVERDLVHHLEEIGGLKLCLPNRDFSPNLKTYASVTYAIHNSKKILCIVTGDFLRDSWCMYQLQMALEDRVYRQDEDCIIFVLLKGPSFEDLGGIQQSLLVMPFIEKNSYALYPQNETDHSAFWQKLVDTIME
ncbi:toll-like receptor 4 [Saccostrea echinata]|uniref:toll-like receptor 4 n=1 Tax=Saccostrea echinata TaxID=191078 RepID=UPI002A808728|nr:toll-like receptor 4 [Saccostrea echinata]